VLVARAAKRVRKAGSVRLVLKLTRAGRRMLRSRKTLGVTVIVTFKPTSGPAVRSTIKVKLRGKPRR
jgi:hypothetical protein